MNNTDCKDLIEKLHDLEAIAYGYNINGEVLGMDCSDFEQIMVDSAAAITYLQEQLAKVTAERDALAANSRPVVYGEWRDQDGNPVGWDKYNPTCPARRCWCSNCGENLTASDEYPVEGLYCPHCGADMRGKKAQGNE